MDGYTKTLPITNTNTSVISLVNATTQMQSMRSECVIRMSKNAKTAKLAIQPIVGTRPMTDVMNTITNSCLNSASTNANLVAKYIHELAMTISNAKKRINSKAKSFFV